MQINRIEPDLCNGMCIFQQINILNSDVMTAQRDHVVIPPVHLQVVFHRLHVRRVQHFNSLIAQQLGVGLIRQQIVWGKGHFTAEVAQYLE